MPKALRSLRKTPRISKRVPFGYRPTANWFEKRMRMCLETSITRLNSSTATAHGAQSNPGSLPCILESSRPFQVRSSSNLLTIPNGTRSGPATFEGNEGNLFVNDYIQSSSANTESSTFEDLFDLVVIQPVKRLSKFSSVVSWLSLEDDGAGP